MYSFKKDQVDRERTICEQRAKKMVQKRHEKDETDLDRQCRELEKRFQNLCSKSDSNKGSLGPPPAMPDERPLFYANNTITK